MTRRKTFTPLPDDDVWCAGCTACCRWPGEVSFSPSALPALAACLGIDERECAETFFDVNTRAKCLQTKPTHDGRCIFIGDDGCRVYPHRPAQCRSFPYTWQRPEKRLMHDCALYQDLLRRAEETSET